MYWRENFRSSFQLALQELRPKPHPFHYLSLLPPPHQQKQRYYAKIFGLATWIISFVQIPQGPSSRNLSSEIQILDNISAIYYVINQCIIVALGTNLTCSTSHFPIWKRFRKQNVNFNWVWVPTTPLGACVSNFCVWTHSRARVWHMYLCSMNYSVCVCVCRYIYVSACNCPYWILVVGRVCIRLCLFVHSASSFIW